MYLKAKNDARSSCGFVISKGDGLEVDTDRTPKPGQLVVSTHGVVCPYVGDGRDDVLGLIVQRCSTPPWEVDDC